MGAGCVVRVVPSITKRLQGGPADGGTRTLWRVEGRARTV
jgi:hypothetical protein